MCTSHVVGHQAHGVLLTPCTAKLKHSLKAEMNRQSCDLRKIHDNARKDGCSCNLQTRQEGSEFRMPLDKAGQLPCMNVGRILLPELWRQARSVGCMREMRERSRYESVSCSPLALFS